MPTSSAIERYQGVLMNNNVDAKFDGKSLADMFKTYTLALNETVYNAMYLADSGFGSSLVTGMAPTVTFTGDFNPEDEACAMFAAMQFKTGADRVKTFTLTRGTDTISVPATATTIAIAGGDAGQPCSISVTLTFDGMPGAPTSGTGG